MTPFHFIRTIRIAADARFSNTNFVDDQIWELNLSGGDPDASAVSTSYGRRTQSVRLFHAYILGDETVTSPQQYQEQPRITACFPSYVQTSSFPFVSVEAQTEYWAPESHLLASRTCLINHSEVAVDLKLILFAAHPAGPAGRGLSQQRVEGVNVLTGEAGNIQPLIFMNGGAVFPDAVFPGLQVSARLQPGEFRYWTWVHAGLDQVQQSFRAARSFVYENWDARIARLEMLNAGFLRVETGEPEWDLAFYLSQRTALASMMSPTHFLPHASYVKGRVPDSGYSHEGRGRDYDARWSGQQIQETGLLISNLVYAAPEMAEGLLLNFLHRQRLDGFAEGRPGLAGERSDHRCPPLLATLAWELYQHTGNRELLRSTHDGFLALFNSWFSAEQDRDEDGFPEWDSILHAEFEYWKPFVRWYPWGGAMEVSGAETVDLLSLLLREVTSLQLILEELGEQEQCDALDQRRHALQEQEPQERPQRRRHQLRRSGRHAPGTPQQEAANIRRVQRVTGRCRRRGPEVLTNELTDIQAIAGDRALHETTFTAQVGSIALLEQRPITLITHWRRTHRYARSPQVLQEAQQGATTTAARTRIATARATQEGLNSGLIDRGDVELVAANPTSERRNHRSLLPHHANRIPEPLQFTDERFEERIERSHHPVTRADRSPTAHHSLLP